MLPAVNYIIVLDKLNSHKVEEAKVEAKRLGIGQFPSHPTPRPEPKGDLSNLCKACEWHENIIKEALYWLPKNLSFAATCGLPNSLRLVLITRASVHNHESAAARPVLDYLSRVSQAESCRKAVL